MKNIFNALESAEGKNDFSEIRLALAPPEKIQSWSYGEVRVPETINYRTFRPEPGGLFCAKIFGPMKDFECLCGKYKRVKYRGVVCEKCGVEVTLARVRRERMAHINLACPVAHILFFKALPSRVGLILDLAMRDIERILYFEVYVVVDPERASELERGQLLRADEYKTMRDKYGNGFKAGIGAEGVRDFLKSVDLKTESEILRAELNNAGSDTRRKKIFKRLKIVENFQAAGLRPEWMVLEKLPVLPPDLRPLVQLEGGRFTTSDLNDLYRRVINRNNRLKRLMDLDAPEVIVNNEKRMLQEAVDSLLDNGRRGKPSLGANRRPLKSVVDIIKGKSGRFRQNLLGKRVDFSGRSVIVVGPDLKLHQCGLPKQMALTLFRPFVFNKLIADGVAASVKNARVMVDAEDPEVWDALEEVIKQHPVLLNRAPTLHRLGVQAFEPVLTEGKAIQLHPLVCVAFNADFDGDQMAVHVPLSVEAQSEARVLMLSSNNILAPANGEPIIVPTQDVVLGLYYATRESPDSPGAGMRFTDVAEVERALAAGVVKLQTPIEVRLRREAAADEDAPSLHLVKTTAGRALLNQFLPPKLEFARINRPLKKRDIVDLIKESFRRCGHRDTVIFCDQLMRFGFERATRAAVSVCMDDMIIPPEKNDIIAETEAKIRETRAQFQNGLLTEDERYNKSVDYWDKAGERVSRVMMKHISSRRTEDGGERESFNSIYMMADSGARGSETQIKQLAGMRGLMTKPDGRIMENAITANFREGLSVLQYFISTHGARKGLSDTALKTANSGYLTRRLVDVTQDVVISEMDCGVENGIVLRPVIKDGNEQAPLFDRILGRTLVYEVAHPQTGNVICPAGTYIDEQAAQNIAEAGVDEAMVRSPVTCGSEYGICVKCYGRDLGRGGRVRLGEAVGVVAAQSIGEPGTQLTMRTFHIGGAASREVVADNVNSRNAGVVRLNVRYVANSDGDLVVVSRGGEMSVQEISGRERERYRLQYGQILKVRDGETIEAGRTLSQRDPMARPIVAEYAGRAKLENIEMGVNAREQTDEMTGLSIVTITENKQGGKKAKQPQIKFLLANGGEVKIPGTDTPVTILLLPGAILPSKVCRGEQIAVGDILAKMPQKTAKSRDITGGLPRVAELFEAREPKEPAILANASGRVSLRGLQRGKQVLAIVDDDKKETHHIAEGRTVLHKGDEISAGDVIAAPDGDAAEVYAGLSGLFSVRDANPRTEKEVGIEIRHQVLDTCRSDKVPPRLKTWAERLSASLEDSVNSPEKFRDIVVSSEKALRKIASSTAAGGGISSKKLGGWYRAFSRRVSPEKETRKGESRKPLPPHLREWADGLVEMLSDKERSYEKLRNFVVSGERGLSKIVSGKEDKLLLVSWRKRMEAIDLEYHAMFKDKSAGAARVAMEQETDLRKWMKDIVAGVKGMKVSGGAKIVEIVSAKFHSVPKGRTILAQDGSSIGRGEEIVDGESNPHEILKMRGVDALVEHIVGEVQDVYRLQGVNISDKHIEVIIRQMLRNVEITDAGDSTLIPAGENSGTGDRVTRAHLSRVNAALVKDEKSPAKGRQVLLGITKASLATDSFISAASFQETSRVLTDAAVSGDPDKLLGLKENVIIGKLVPAGTGFVEKKLREQHDAQLEAEHILREGLEVGGEEAPAEADAAPAEETPPADG